MADGGLAVEEGVWCQEPAEFTLYYHNTLVSTPGCTAETCVSTLDIRVRSTLELDQLSVTKDINILYAICVIFFLASI